MKNETVIQYRTESNDGFIVYERLILRVLRFFRLFLHLSTRELSILMIDESGNVDNNKKDSYSKSLIGAVESGTRNPSEEFIKAYAKALEKEAKLTRKRSLLDIAQKCIGDPELLKLMDQYEKKEGGFKTICNISEKIQHLIS